jgi:thymidylate kinase
MAGRESRDRFELEQLEFFGRDQARDRALASAEPERIKLVDAAQSLDDVQLTIKGILDTSILYLR